MDYIGHIFRPPSEAESLLLQVTVGCSHNGCTYCGMYRDPVQRFRMKPLDVVAQDVEEAAVYDRDVEPIRRVFLWDGDALGLPTKSLLEILALLRLGKCNDIPDTGGAAQQCDHAVQSEGDASMWGRTVGERLQHVSKTTVDDIGRNLQDVLKHLLLQGGLVNPDGTSAEFHAIQHDIIMLAADRLWIRIQ